VAFKIDRIDVALATPALFLVKRLQLPDLGFVYTQAEAC
jgi:hypothetical protein